MVPFTRAEALDMKQVCSLSSCGEDTDLQPNTSYLGLFVLMLYLHSKNMSSKLGENINFLEMVQNVCISVFHGSAALSVPMRCYFDVSGLAS